MVDISRDILIQAAEGDIKAFEQVYNSASGFVYNVAFRITNNRSDAEDVTQDVFMRIFRGLKDFKFESSFKTWAYRITVNTAINKYRQSLRENNRRREYKSEADRQLSTDKTNEFIDNENAEKDVASLLNKLDAGQRACIVLREIEGLSYKEMSELLKININTVRSRLRRARQALLENAKGKVITYGL
jgi:RNA polymerase sigma-70 factor (ECF subfamily)